MRGSATCQEYLLYEAKRGVNTCGHSCGHVGVVEEKKAAAAEAEEEAAAAAAATALAEIKHQSLQPHHPMGAEERQGMFLGTGSGGSGHGNLGDQKREHLDTPQPFILSRKEGNALS